MTPQEQEDAKVVKDLQALARHVDAQLPYGWGFIVLAFPFGAGGRMNYVANAERADVVRAMYEFIEASKGQWAEHEAPMGAAAEDEQLGRARQRIAELEALFNETNLRDLEYLLEVATARLAENLFSDKWLVRARKYQELIRQRLKELSDE